MGVCVDDGELGQLGAWRRIASPSDFHLLRCDQALAGVVRIRPTVLRFVHLAAPCGFGVQSSVGRHRAFSSPPNCHNLFACHSTASSYVAQAAQPSLRIKPPVAKLPQLSLRASTRPNLTSGSCPDVSGSGDQTVRDAIGDRADVAVK